MGEARLEVMEKYVPGCASKEISIGIPLGGRKVAMTSPSSEPRATLVIVSIFLSAATWTSAKNCFRGMVCNVAAACSKAQELMKADLKDCTSY